MIKDDPSSAVLCLPDGREIEVKATLLSIVVDGRLHGHGTITSGDISGLQMALKSTAPVLLRYQGGPELVIAFTRVASSHASYVMTDVITRQ